MKVKGVLILFFSVFLFVCVVIVPQAQSVTMDFEGVVEPDSQILPSLPYSEDGFTIENLTVPGEDFEGIFGKDTGFNSNGSSVFAWCADVAGPQTFLLTSDISAPFTMYSLDASNMVVGYFVDGMSIEVVGNIFGGGTVFQSFNIMEDTWTTFYFGSEFTNLVSLEITNSVVIDDTHEYPPDFVMDNLVINTIPEPANMLLYGIGLLSLAGITRRKK